MRYVQLTGYVQKDIKVQDNRMMFSISNYKGKDKDGKSTYQYVNIKLINSDILLEEGDFVLIHGDLDIFTYNEKKYTQVVCFNDGVGIIRKAGASNGGGGFKDDGIPF